MAIGQSKLTTVVGGIKRTYRVGDTVYLISVDQHNVASHLLSTVKCIMGFDLSVCYDGHKTWASPAFLIPEQEMQEFLEEKEQHRLEDKFIW